jgi:hypothetical protein
MAPAATPDATPTAIGHPPAWALFTPTAVRERAMAEIAKTLTNFFISDLVFDFRSLLVRCVSFSLLHNPRLFLSH